VRPSLVSAKVGGEIEVRVSAEHVAHLAGCQFDLRFDPDLLEVISVEEGEFMGLDGVETFWRDPDIDNDVGLISGAAITRKGGTGVEGSGTVAIIKFKAKNAGSSLLKLENVTLSDVDLNPIGVNVVTASVKIGEVLKSWDIDKSGTVDIFDLVFVSRHFGETITYPLPDPTAPNPDVDGNGMVDVFDLVLVSKHFGEEIMPGAPTLLDVYLTATVIRTRNGIKLKFERPVWAIWSENIEPSDNAVIVLKTPKGKSLALALREPVDELSLRRIDPSLPIVGIDSDMRLVSIRLKNMPDRTVLLPNYPNPFNPETWIPFQLAEDADVTIRIYDLRGNLIKTLDLGHLKAGYYTSRSSAAHWDGRNELGERVASGVYIYRMKVGDKAFTGKMVILK
ncbi:TPA: T9SS type A sorting domain-containing protein, partial [Candidatus Poribacteria bacterium]|nr:T9SS type A sorting domain-containing protein [Candidatus Poribacteria bacterium]HEX28622.1 T9SS type A sorting domain-containing protein [Candidatus Poribacteria bacterium]